MQARPLEQDPWGESGGRALSECGPVGTLRTGESPRVTFVIWKWMRGGREARLMSPVKRVDLSQDTEETGSCVVATLHHPQASHAS